LNRNNGLFKHHKSHKNNTNRGNGINYDCARLVYTRK